MHTVLATDRAPQAIGPYSQGIFVGGFLFLSGQIALDPLTGQLVGADAAAQTAQVMANIRALLESAGLDVSNVVKTTIYLVDLADFSAVNDVYGQCFPVNPPARSTVAVRGLPRGALVEIEAIAWQGA